MKKLLLLVLAAVMLTGCKSTFNTAPIANYIDQTAPKALTMEKMEKCIVTAGAELGWKMKSVKPGLMEGTLLQRGHTAVVSIPYTAQKFSIVYKSSSEGLYADGSGKIHKIYNTWVGNLDREINAKITEELYQ